MKSISLILLLVVSTAMANENKRPEALNVDSACSADATTAGCGDKKVGTGLLKCIESYRKEHKSFKVSESCKNARLQLRSAIKSTPKSNDIKK